MKKFLIMLLLLPAVGFATITAEKEFALNRLSGVAKKYELGTELAKKPNVVVGKYSFAVQGGSSVATLSLLRDLFDTHSTITIPDNSIVKQVWFDGLTNVTGGSVAVTLQTTADLFAAAGGTGTSGIKAGVPVDTVATMIKLTADRSLVLTVTNGDLTAGAFNVYVEYVLGD